MIYRDREDLLVVFYDTGILETMYRSRVNYRGTLFHNMTPLELAEHEKKKCKDDLEQLIDKEKALHRLPVCMAARRNDVNEVKRHVQANRGLANESSTLDGSTPVFWAAVAGNTDLMAYLVDNNANMSCKYAIV